MFHRKREEKRSTQKFKCKNYFSLVSVQFYISPFANFTHPKGRPKRFDTRQISAQISSASDRGRVEDARSLQSPLASAARRTLRFRRCAPSCQYHLQGSLPSSSHSALSILSLINLLVALIFTRSSIIIASTVAGQKILL